MPLSLINLILCTAMAAAVQLPFLPNMTLVPKSNSSSITVTHRSCDECLCESNLSYSILNCFPNNTCQFFVDAPRTYQFQPILNGTVYFPRQILPNASQGCMPNTTHLLNQLNNATPTYAPVNGPRCLLMDNHGYLVTISYSDKSIVRFHPDNLTLVSPSPSLIFTHDPRSIAYNNGAYYVGFATYILVVDSNTMTQIHNISTPSINATRDMIFPHNGQQMIVASADNDLLLFFNRSNTMPHDYDFIGLRNVGYQVPHGLVYINDTLFYAISYKSKKVYAYSNAGNATEWTEKLVFNASSVGHSSEGNHVSVDDCDRYWLSLGTDGVTVFDIQGSSFGSLHPTGANIFDTLMLDNYVTYLSDIKTHRIIRIDPQIQC